ncbi:MAG: glycosyltransferase [Clostridia bacterium]|nr:glycosyltransferase [Clostridia bacterium]
MVKIESGLNDFSFQFLLECPNEQFLENAYLNLLNRMPDEIGLIHYAQRLQSGIPRQVILVEIWNTRLKQGGAVSKSTDMDKLVTRYRAVRRLAVGKMRWRLLPKFGKHIPDVSEFDWIAWARSYLSEAHVSAKNTPSRDDSLTRAENNASIDWPRISFDDFLALPDEAFLENAFRVLLGRKIDDAGMQQYLSALLDGQERLHILQDIYYSEEATSMRTFSDLDDVEDDSYLSAVYQRLLGRRPDWAAVQGYQPLIDNDQRRELLADLLSSSEYMQRHAPRANFESELEDALQQWSLAKSSQVFSDAAHDSYLHWIGQYERLSKHDRKCLVHRAKGWTESPLITVVIRTMELNLDYLIDAILSVCNQIYPHWQLVVAIPSTSDTKIETVLRVHSEADARIRIERLFSSENDLSEICSKVLEKVKDGYLLFMDSTDQIDEAALFWIAETLRNQPKCRLIYSDEDTISADGIRSNPYFKPDYNYELHLAQDLMGRTCVFELELLRSIGGFRPGCVAAEYWDISLRAVEKLELDQIVHIARVLYHQRAERTLPSEEIRLRVVQKHLQRKSITGKVVPAPDAPQYNRVVYERASHQPSVTIIIPTRDNADLLERCIASIRQKSSYQNYDILIVDNGSKTLETRNLLKKLSEEEDVRVECMDIPFNFAVLNNTAATKTSADLLCFLNDDTEILTSDWLEEMSSFATQKNVGIVGARLWYPDGRLQHGGVIIGMNGVSDHVFKGMERGETGYFGRAVLHQSYSAVTGACMLVLRKVFEQVGGFDESFEVTLNDIDLCLRVRDLGYRNVWTPYAELIHYESATRGTDKFSHKNAKSVHEIALFTAQWMDELYNDSAYNINLDLYSTDFSLAHPPRKTRYSYLSAVNLAKLEMSRIPALKEMWPQFTKALVYNQKDLILENDFVKKENYELKREKQESSFLINAIRNEVLQMSISKDGSGNDIISLDIMKYLDGLMHLSKNSPFYINGHKINFNENHEIVQDQKGILRGYSSIGQDPYFILQNSFLTPGWYRVYLSMNSDIKKFIAKIYFDYGFGFNEINTIILPVYSGSVLSRVFFISQNVHQIRFDPLEDEVFFEIESFRIEPLSENHAKAIMLHKISEQEQNLSSNLLNEHTAVMALSDSKDFHSAKKILIGYNECFVDNPSDISYDEWIENIESPGEPTPEIVNNVLESLSIKPLISIVMPTYNTPEIYLKACINSILAQSYPHWELCIADDCSTNSGVRQVLKEYENKDSRIKVVYRIQNGHISKATNSALELASGEYVALLDHDDKLTEHALYFMVLAINNNPDSQILYSDEDKIDHKDRRFDPHFKSDWNPDLLYSQNYISHLGLYSCELLKTIGGFRTGVEGSQDHDLFLRCLPFVHSSHIIHVPRILYHWRAAEGSTALASNEKNYASDAGIKALENYFTTNGPLGLRVENGLVPNAYHIIWPVPDAAPLVSLLMPTRDRKTITEIAVRSILEKTTYSNYEIIIIDNGSIETETLEWFSAIQKENSRVRVLRYDYPFNYSAINNFGVSQVSGSLIGLINNDIEVISPDWLTEMVSHALRADIGCVGAKLYYSNGTLQHGGVILGIGGVAGHSHKYFNKTDHGYFSRLKLVQNCSAVTAACLIVRKDIYEAVGGLDEKNLQVAFNDVDFCLKVRVAGYRNLWTPYAELFHHESISRGAEDSPEKQERFRKEVEFMQTKWGDLLKSDPYYNPNLTQDREDFSISST